MCSCRKHLRESVCICGLRFVLASLAGFLLVGSVQALDTLPLLDDGPSRSLLQDKKTIYAETSGSVPVAFPDALVVFGQPDLLQRVQDVYYKR